MRSEFRFRFLAACVALVLVVLMLDGAAHLLMAQTPFGGPRPSGAEAPPSGLVGWLLAKQSEFYRQMSSTIRAAKSDGSAVWTLLAISFAYGIFHAAGPGHGKAVISSYLVANQETARRGIVLSFASALMQSLVAVVIVGICAWLLNATARTMCGAERVIEIASYALIAAFGARLVWTKGGGFFRALRTPQLVPRWRLRIIMTITIMTTTTTTTITAMFMPVWRMMITGIATTLTGIIKSDGHVHDEHCGHFHGPDPSELAGPGGWRRGFGAIFAVGIRPCSGAILVLVFALAQGLFWAGRRGDLRDGARHRDHGSDHCCRRCIRERSRATLERRYRRWRRAGHARRRIRRRGIGAAVRRRPAVRLRRRRTSDLSLAI